MRINIIIEELKEYFDKLSNKELADIVDSKDPKYDDFTKQIHNCILNDRNEKGIIFEKEYYENRHCQYELWCLNGKRHRPSAEGPAHITYYKNGHLECEKWILNGKFHRPIIEGPAYIGYYEHGKLELVTWWLNGLRHRPSAEGPAFIEYYENGQIKVQQYYENGIQITK